MDAPSCLYPPFGQSGTGQRFISRPACQFKPRYLFRNTETLLAIPLLPDVANGIIVLPLKSWLSINVSTTRGAISHQIG